MIATVTSDQIILFILLIAVFAGLIWGRWRYDVVAFVALLAALLTGIVPTKLAFSGFGHPATIIIALVLVVSRGLSNSGAIELLARFVVDSTRKLGTHIAVMSSLAAVLSAIMNNVAALALLMPIDIQAATKAKRSPSRSAPQNGRPWHTPILVRRPLQFPQPWCELSRAIWDAVRWSWKRR